MVDKSKKLTRMLYTALASSQPEHIVNNLNTGPEIPGHNPEGKSGLYEKKEATEDARKEVGEWGNGTLAADPRTTEEIVKDEAIKRLQKYR